jgi:RimJ/RimL family protein N-acetyltransferase
MDPAPVPDQLRTERLLLRRWRAADAVRLRPVLEANAEHLGGWIPAHVAAPAPLPELERRLAGFAADFAAARSWRFAILTADEGDLLGEISLFPRDASGRVPFAHADRVEIGYWLRADVTGRGFATEAARAMVELAGRLGMPATEIRCDPRNVASAAVPQRLGFRLVAPEAGAPADAAPPAAQMVWVRDAGVPAPGPPAEPPLERRG